MTTKSTGLSPVQSARVRASDVRSYSIYPTCGSIHPMDGAEQVMDETKTAGISQAIHYRNYRRARDRALARLAKEYPDQYQEYLQEEKASDEATSKKWISVGATVSVSTSIESYKDAIEGAVDPDNDGENQSYYGGEEE